MKLVYKEEPRTLALLADSVALTISQYDPASSSSSTPPTVEAHLEDVRAISKENGFRLLIKRDIHGCLGLISIEGEIYLAVITGALTDVARPVANESVNKIFSVEFVSVGSDEWDFVNLDSNGYPLAGNGEPEDGANGGRRPHPCIDLKKLLLNGLFYYSNDFDLTSQLQKRGVDTGGSRTRVNLSHYEEQYMWNSFMMDELIRFRANLDDVAVGLLDSSGFLTSVIRGFAKTVGVPGRGDSFTIISRQLWKRAGTRFNARGIDDDGHVANFVETEFIYNNQSRHHVYAFAQVRGSVPAFWEQDSTLINPKITVTRSRDASQPAFDRHFDHVCQKYSACHIVNLLSNTRSQEVDVLRRYKELLDRSPHAADVAYSHFDFHAETKQLSGGFAGASKILPLLDASLDRFGWYCVDTASNDVVMRQDGVFRVNCLDCLDRTNLVEQVVCQAVLEHILRSADDQGSNPNRLRCLIDDLSARHNTLWADNGDAISQIYTGTNALKSSFSRSGKMNFSGALSDVTKSVSRMYQNTFVDSKKQSTIDLLLGKDAKNHKPVKIYDRLYEFVHEKLRQNASAFTSYADISLFVATFNVSAATNPSRADLDPWLFPSANDNSPAAAPDVVAIGLQEIIELNAGSFLAADSSKPGQWGAFLDKKLNSRSESYFLLRTESIASMCLFLFVKKNNLHHVTDVAGTSKKTGLGGITANKGACAVRFDFGATSFVLVTSHLAAGATAIMERHYDYQLILQGLLFTRNYTISDHDHVVWFGDLNYRVDLPNDKCRALLASGSLDELKDADQLLAERAKRGGAFYGFHEPELTFLPTYKFDRGTCNYDTSEKQRTPSWTDRILFHCRGKEKLTPLNYGSVMDILLSDHKPVYATYRANVKFVDKQKKQLLTHDYYKGYKGGLMSTLIDFGESSSFEKTPTSNSSFSSDALSEMNLLADDSDTKTPPKVPMRHPLATVNTLPRRVPPPPLAAPGSPAKNNPQLPPRKTPSSPPPPPPSRKSNPSPAYNHLFAFSTPPLVPSNSQTPTPRLQSPAASSHVSPTPTASENAQPLRPLVPTKPHSLSSTKVNGTPADSLKSDTSKPKPAPPPPRATSANKEPSKSMMEWKPLVPQ